MSDNINDLEKEIEALDSQREKLVEKLNELRNSDKQKLFAEVKDAESKYLKAKELYEDKCHQYNSLYGKTAFDAFWDLL